MQKNDNKLLFSGQTMTYAFPDINGKRALVMGIGGGSDATGAYSLAAFLQENNPRATIIYANCSGTIPGEFPGFERAGKNMLRRRAGAKPDATTSDTLSSTTIALMRRLPITEGGCPFLVIVPKNADDDARRGAMQDALNQLQPQVIFAIDSGSDALTGGMKGENGDGFDRKGLRALKQCGAPFTFLAFGPGCDGESTVNEIRNAIKRERDSLLGQFDMEDILVKMLPYKPPLRKDGTPNTPNVMLDARSQIKKTPGDAFFPYKVERHKRPDIPARWLVTGLAFNGMCFLANRD